MVPAPVGGELRHEEVTRPIRFESDLGREFERDVLMLVEVGVEHVVGEDGADLGLGEQQEGFRASCRWGHKGRDRAPAARGCDGARNRAECLGSVWLLLPAASTRRSRARRPEAESQRRTHPWAALQPAHHRALGCCHLPCRRGALSASLLEAAAKEGSRRQGGAGPWAWNQPSCPESPGRWRPSSHLAARCCRARTVRSHIGPLPARRRQRAGLQRERPLRLSNGDAARTRSSIDTGAPGRPPASTRPLIRKA